MNESKEEMIDTVEIIGKGSVVHHGKSNDRVYLMSLMPADYVHIVTLLEGLAERYQYTKILCKIPSHAAPVFIASGYFIEGYIPGFYNGKVDAFFVSRFLNQDRSKLHCVPAMQQFFSLLHIQTGVKQQFENNNTYVVKKLTEEHALEMAKLYAGVFKSYPFPIFDPSYLIKTMNLNIQYFGAFKAGELVALASSEMDVEAQNAEMTDFATLSQHAGHHLSRLLLATMEESMKAQGIKTLYTIARLNSIPMNKTFLSAGYAYSGTLINNTQIFGSIESMNLYYKLP